LGNSKWKTKGGGNGQTFFRKVSFEHHLHGVLVWKEKGIRKQKMRGLSGRKLTDLLYIVDEKKHKLKKKKKCDQEGEAKGGTKGGVKTQKGGGQRGIRSADLSVETPTKSSKRRIFNHREKKDAIWR